MRALFSGPLHTAMLAAVALFLQARQTICGQCNNTKYEPVLSLSPSLCADPALVFGLVAVLEERSLLLLIDGLTGDLCKPLSI